MSLIDPELPAIVDKLLSINGLNFYNKISTKYTYKIYEQMNLKYLETTPTRLSAEQSLVGEKLETEYDGVYFKITEFISVDKSLDITHKGDGATNFEVISDTPIIVTMNRLYISHSN